VFRYRLHSPDGDDLGEATYAVMIKLGEEIHLGAGQTLRRATGPGRAALVRSHSRAHLNKTPKRPTTFRTFQRIEASVPE
jgi:hypothetical protein